MTDNQSPPAKPALEAVRNTAPNSKQSAQAAAISATKRAARSARKPPQNPKPVPATPKMRPAQDPRPVPPTPTSRPTPLVAQTKQVPTAKKPAAKQVPKPAVKPAPKPAAKPAPKPAAKPKPKSKKPEIVIAPTAGDARQKKRHYGVFFSLIFLVLLPVGTAAWYLYQRAVDQYPSSVAFTVRREEAPSAGGLLGSLSYLSSASSSDSDILYEFIQSQELVLTIDRKLNLREVFSRHYEQDPVFSLTTDSTIEELVDYWRKMVRISYAPGTGLLKLRVMAFAPEEAQAIATAIFTESSRMINELSAIAREDSIRYAREDLDRAVEQLKTARLELTAFRSRTQVIDPSADIQLQMGLLTTLQQQLGEELITYDLLRENARENDPRILQVEQRIAAIRKRIRQEREKFGSGGSEDGEPRDYVKVIADFERLTVERGFAEQKYTSALSNYDLAQAKAQRQSRYLAAYINPTRSESSQHPKRLLLLGLTALFLFASWSTLVLIYYSLRDRR